MANGDRSADVVQSRRSMMARIGVMKALIVAMATANTTGVADIVVADTPYPAVTAPTSIFGTDNVIPTGRCPRSFRRAGFALGTTDTSPPA
jgi:hypothetical protein